MESEDRPLRAVVEKGETLNPASSRGRVLSNTLAESIAKPSVSNVDTMTGSFGPAAEGARTRASSKEMDSVVPATADDPTVRNVSSPLTLDMKTSRGPDPDTVAFARADTPPYPFSPLGTKMVNVDPMGRSLARTNSTVMSVMFSTYGTPRTTRPDAAPGVRIGPATSLARSIAS
eukprot:3201366-Rhodomonas_salina.4